METRVYVINVNQLTEVENKIFNNQIMDFLFMDIAEKQGTVYTLKGFETAFNEGEINSDNLIIRII